ncbi:MAG TPA: sigma-70 family RNA polymerase sigma factor [Anaeromyxobacteraceae bacterium]|nr:sigma-70 family RNA polymerase sigma factor [Anaeromyxobacteraceae bacterium]
MARMTPEDRVHELAAQGDLQRAATEALRWLGPEVLGYLTAMVKSESDAAEVFSQFAEDLWRGFAGFRWESSLRTWVYRIAYHAAARFARDPFRQRGQRFETTMASRIADDVRRSSVLRRDLREQKLAELRATLDPDERTLLILRVDRKLSWREVAEVLVDQGGAPAEEAALRKRFERIKDKLEKKARQAGLLE